MFVSSLPSDPSLLEVGNTVKLGPPSFTVFPTSRRGGGGVSDLHKMFLHCHLTLCLGRLGVKGGGGE